MKIFGKPEDNMHYSHRPGAYGVLFNNDKKVAVVEVSGRLLLPGGGIEPGEDPATALQREFEEETGIALENIQYMCQTGEYMFTLDGTRCEFIIADLFYATAHRVVSSPIEEDHKLVWIDSQSASADLFRPGQQWAVEEALRRISG